MSRGWKKPLLIGCFGIPLLTCGIGGGLLCNSLSRTASKLPEEVAKLKALGVPTEVADLAPNPAVSEANNAASLYQSIGYQLEAIEKDATQKDLVKLLDSFGASESPQPDLSKVLVAIQNHQSLFSDAGKLSAKPHIDFKRDYAKGAMVLFPEYADMKRIAKWQCSRARAQWMTGDRTAALKTLRAAFRTGEHSAQEPQIIGQLVCMAMTAICHRTLETFITDARNEPAMLRQMEAMLTGLKDRSDMRKGFGGEIVMGRATLRGMKGSGSFKAMGDMMNDPNMRDMGWVDALLSAPHMKGVFEFKFLEAWRLTFESIPKDPEDWNGFSQAVDQRIQAIEKNKSLDNILNRILFPVMAQAVDAAAKQVAERRLELLSLKLLQTRSQGLPANLASFGKLAIDPFTGKKMGYQRNGKAFKIWSIGPDRVDQGGVGRAKGQQGNKGIDIVMGFDMPIPKATP